MTRNDNASTLMVGWRSTNSPIGWAANIITSTEGMIAKTITATSSARPRARSRCPSYAPAEPVWASSCRSTVATLVFPAGMDQGGLIG